MQSTSYMGDGSTTEFFFNFPYYENTDIIVTKNNQPATDYTIIGTPGGENADIPYTGGKVVFAVAPTALDCITISRSLPLTRVVDYQPTEKINPTLLNQDANYLMEVIKDLHDKFDNLSEKYAEIADKDSTATLLARIDEINDEIIGVNQTINDLNTEIENGQIMSRDKFYSYATNCLTKIPQDINLILSNGTLTLKAGSKYYVPNGSGVFDTVASAWDSSQSQSTFSDEYLCFVTENGDFNRMSLSHCFSGSTAPTQYTYMLWYDTTNNIVKRTLDGGSTWISGCSLPIAIVSTVANTSTNIDQIFNGFGYIGSTVFVLPGISGLIPDGRNADGTLKNIQSNCTEIKTLTVSGTTSIYLAINNSGTLGTLSVSETEYKKQENRNYCNGDAQSYALVGKYDVSSDKITNFKPDTVFSCVA